MGNSNAFKAIIALIFIMVGVFVYISYTGEDTSNRSQNLDDSSTTVTKTAQGEEEEGAADSGLSAEEAAVVELCDCFRDILDFRSKIAEDPDLEFELSSKIKKAEISMRSCYTKTKQRHSGFGETLIEDFEMACPEAQEEL
ncbi:MAG: hypothetical protein AB8G11_15035 [Saprospiraceae bacterium]